MPTIRSFLEHVYLERETIALEEMDDKSILREWLISGIVPLKDKSKDNLIYACKIHCFDCPNCQEEVDFDSFEVKAESDQAICSKCNQPFDDI
jgi:hypothetical protein